MDPGGHKFRRQTKNTSSKSDLSVVLLHSVSVQRALDGRETEETEEIPDGLSEYSSPGQVVVTTVFELQHEVAAVRTDIEPSIRGPIMLLVCDNDAQPQTNCLSYRHSHQYIQVSS